MLRNINVCVFKYSDIDMKEREEALFGNNNFTTSRYPNIAIIVCIICTF